MAPKKKQEKMALGDFLTNQSLGSWADEMESAPLPSMPTSSYGARDRDRGDRGDRGPPPESRALATSSWERTSSGVGGGFGGDRGAGGGMGARGSDFGPRYDREAIPFPTKPPYTAHLGNLDYNVTSVDLEGFLADCNVTVVRLMEDKIDRKPKGFGYAEFGSPEGLQKALDRSESSFMGRNIKISVADPPRNDRADSNRDFSDWSRKGPLPDLPSQGRQPSRGFERRGPPGGGGFDNMSDAGSERGGPGGRRPGFFEGDGKPRDFSNWERKGPLSPVPGQGPPVRDGGRLREAGGPREERGGASWGEGRSDAGSRPPRREYERPQGAPERPERAPTAAEQDSQWRTNMRPDAAATPDVSTPTSPAQEAPKERPRLNLAKRTVSTAEGAESAGNTPSDAKASPFGAARPIDTSAREKEVEEKRVLALRQKEEADVKAREEKAAKDAEGRAARADRADRGQAGENVTSPTGDVRNEQRGDRRPPRQQQNGGNSWRGKPKDAPENKQQAKENGEAPVKERPTFNVLSQDGEDGDLDTPNADANGTIIDDKETKPQEPVVVAGESADSTAEALEDDGWSTVPAKAKSNRRGGGRAIAS
ncbi:Putative RNA recognition motif domain, nucleotide-binding alpha-beta plait domain superfamily [Septoria linicola]|uniref:RNA recognition motif domain, nucleotide-binding alpha-beta plait domain superfamily n=1 Tax=Septoria linicola TaxID=215465 RepID=A0A9Q9AIY2_9PEZI|nr:putative RNA recognition motif domain, nucleotide-binding alpha-beta plait domain superfamily [Septoria linicola]USW50224.1 Putative RNA recognition motif domain, nucleotide-binding alpha-beta plait domain superfamily [Septoria linicola]